MKDFKTILQDLVDLFIEKEEGSHTKALPSNTNIWKSSDGTWQFAGIFSNNYMDKDKRFNIISADAHRKFEKALDDGLVPMPFLRWWHLESNLGEAKQVAYDERGFMIVHGEFYKEYEPLAEALSKWDRPLGMSHRMPPQYITTDLDDDNVITSYVADEVSFLPIERAANPLTYFGVQETDTMLEIQEEKLSHLREALGDERIEQLDLIAARLKEAAGEFGLPSKEEDVEETEEVEQDVEEAADVEPVEEAEDAEEEAQDEPEEKEADEVEADEGVEAEANEEEQEADEPVAEEEPVEDTPELKEEEAVEDEEVYVTRDQLVEVIDYVKEAFDNFAGVVEELRKEAAVTKEEEENRRKQAVEKAQDDVLMSSLASMLGAAQSVVGSEQTVVKEEDDLADKRPEEAPAEQRPFLDNAIFSILEG
jgi:hypothetical protein